MKAIVFGADGFIGSATVFELLSHGYDVFAIDRLEYPHRLPKHADHFCYLPLTDGNIKSLMGVLPKGADVFYDFAWIGTSGISRSDPEVQVKNILLFLDAIQVASEMSCRKFVFASSIIETEAQILAYSDLGKPDSHYVYGGAKASCHMLGKPLANSLGIDLIWANIASVYGIGDMSNGFINSTLKKMAFGGDLLFTEGKQYCDFVYIDDVALAFRLLGERGIANKSYLIGSGSPRMVKDYVKEICSCIKPGARPIFGAIPFSGFLWSKEMFSVSNLEKDCGYSSCVSFCEGIQRTFQWLTKASQSR